MKASINGSSETRAVKRVVFRLDQEILRASSPKEIRTITANDNGEIAVLHLSSRIDLVHGSQLDWDIGSVLSRDQALLKEEG